MARHLFQNDHDDKGYINHIFESLEEECKYNLKSGIPSFIFPVCVVHWTDLITIARCTP